MGSLLLREREEGLWAELMLRFSAALKWKRETRPSKKGRVGCHELCLRSSCVSLRTDTPSLSDQSSTSWT